MAEETGPVIGKVELPFGADPPRIHCPLCGKPTLVAVDDSTEITPCPHLVFIFASVISDFVYQADDFEERAKDVDVEDWDFEDFSKALKLSGYGNNMLAIEVTYGGIANGPVYYTDVFGFDFSISVERDA